MERKIPVIYWGVDIYNDAIAPWLYLFRKYWDPEPGSVDLIISGFSHIPENVWMPPYARFIDVGSPHSGKPDEWIGAYIEFLDSIPNYTHHVHFTEEFWLSGTVDVGMVKWCLDYARNNPEIARIDLSGDILGYANMSGNKVFVENTGNALLRGEGSQYRCSCQVSIWRTAYFKEILKSIGRGSAWDFELKGTYKLKEMCDNGVGVLGTSSVVIPYQNQGVYKIRSFPDVVCLSSFSENDIRELTRRGLVDVTKYTIERRKWSQLQEEQRAKQ